MGYQDPEWLRNKYHSEGMSLKDIADECGVSKTTIYNWMKKHGVERRGTADWKKTKLPDDCCAEFAYILGVVDGDGWFGEYRIQMNVVDRGFAEKFRSSLESAGVGNVLKEMGEQPGNRQYIYRTYGWSKELCEWLGGMDADSRLEFLSGEDYIWNYLEGRYESDGHISNRDYTPSPAYRSHQPDHLGIISELLSRVGVENSVWEDSHTVYVLSGSADRFFKNVDCCIDRRVP